MKEITLKLTESFGIARKRECCTTGVPLPPGSITDANQIQLLNPDGEQCNVSVQPIGQFPDGSLRGVALTFLADIDAFTSQDWTLRVRPRDSAPPFLTEYSDAWLIDTGEASYVVDRFTPRIKQVRNKRGDLLKAPVNIVLRDCNGRPYGLHESAVRSASIDVQDALLTVLRWEGSHVNDEGDTYFDYVIRIAFIAGSSRCRLSYSFINRQLPVHPRPTWHNPDSITSVIGGIRFSVPIAWQETPRVRFNVDRSARPLGSGYQLLTSTDRASESDNPSYKSLDHEGKPTARPPSGFQGLVASDAFALAVTDFEANFPKGMFADVDGIHVDLIPESSPMGIALGSGRTHHIWLDFDNDIDNPDSLLALVAQASHPLTVHPLDSAPPETFGHILPYKPQKYPLYETLFNDLYKRGLEARHFGRLLLGRGMMNHGDQINLNFSLNRNMKWAYANNRWDLLHALSLFTLRSGDVAAHAHLRTVAEHIMDVDQCKASFEDSDLGGIHGVEAINHTFNEPVTFQLWSEGLIDYTLMTGDLRGLEATRLAGAFAERAGRNGRRWSHNIRGSGIPLMLLSRLYEVTREARWLDAAEPYVQELIDTQEADGAWRERRVPKISRAITAPWKCAIALTGLDRFIRATGREDLNETWTKAAYWLIEKGTLPTGVFYYYDMPQMTYAFAHGVCLEPLGPAFEKTGDRAFLDIGHLNLKYMLTQRPDFDNTSGSRDAGFVAFAAWMRGCLRFLYWLDRQDMLNDLQ